MKDAVRKLGAGPKTNSKRAALETKAALVQSLIAKRGHKSVTMQPSRDVPVKMTADSGDMPDTMPPPTVFVSSCLCSSG